MTFLSSLIDRRNQRATSCLGRPRTSADTLLAKAKITLSTNVEPDGNGCLNWTRSLDGQGYPQIGILGSLTRGHRLACALFNGDFDNSLQVLHSCDNPLCLNPDHLRPGTAKDNASDMLSRFRHSMQLDPDAWSEMHSGVRNPRAKLTEEEVLEIRATKKGARGVAKRFGVSSSLVLQIRNGDIWRSLQRDTEDAA